MGVGDGLASGVPDAEGDADGEAEGDADGEAEGDADGEAEGDADGETDGEIDGERLVSPPDGGGEGGMAGETPPADRGADRENTKSSKTAQIRFFICFISISYVL